MAVTIKWTKLPAGRSNPLLWDTAKRIFYLFHGHFLRAPYLEYAIIFSIHNVNPYDCDICLPREVRWSFIRPLLTFANHWPYNEWSSGGQI